MPKISDSRLDRKQASQHLDLILGGDAGTLVVTFDKGGQHRERYYEMPDDRDRLLAEVAGKVRDHDIYVTHARVQGNRKRANALPGRLLFTDIDDGNDLTEARLTGWGAAILLSGSPGHYYPLLELSETESPERIEQVNVLLRDAVGGDDAYAPHPAAILRLAGTFNHKHSPPLPVRFKVPPTGQKRTLAEIEALIQEQYDNVVELKDHKAKTRTKAKSGGGKIEEPTEGTRDQWVIQECGHLAKDYRDHGWAVYKKRSDLLWLKVSSVPADDPYTRERFESTQESAWRTEQEKKLSPQCSVETGWLVGRGNETLVMCKRKDPDGGPPTTTLEHWLNLGLEAVGVAVSDADGVGREYIVNVYSRREGTWDQQTLSDRDLADNRRLARWMIGFGGSFASPLGEVKMGRTDKLVRYLESQDPPVFRVLEALGWDKGADGFVCHEGVIRADGLHKHDKVRPRPILVERAECRYGFEHSEEEVVEVLREALTFQEETVAAVFFSWLMVCPLKPIILPLVSQFPAVGIEAPSSSGKTRGCFAVGFGLIGGAKPRRLTEPVFRDALAASHSFPVWLDDCTDWSIYEEGIRGATGKDGSSTKKGEDRTHDVKASLVAPICLSGEALPIHDSRALKDRFLILEPPPPNDRMSLRDPEVKQVVDVKAMLAKDLTAYSGTLVQMILQRAELATELLQRAEGNRHGDKLAIVQAGAAILADMLDDPSIVERVTAWCDQQDDLGEDELTLSILPLILARTGFQPKRLPPHENGYPTTPIVGERDNLRVGLQDVAQWLFKYYNGRVGRLHSPEAFIKQLRALGCGGAAGVHRKREHLQGNHNDSRSFWVLGPDLSRRIWDRAQDELDTPDGVQQPLRGI
jgi:hypothetical protein